MVVVIHVHLLDGVFRVPVVATDSVPDHDGDVGTGQRHEKRTLQRNSCVFKAVLDLSTELASH